MNSIFNTSNYENISFVENTGIQFLRIFSDGFSGFDLLFLLKVIRILLSLALIIKIFYLFKTQFISKEKEIYERIDKKDK